MNERPISKSGKRIASTLSGERINYGVRGSFCALDKAVPDILGCLRTALRHVGCGFDGPRPNGANGDGDRKHDRKESFHGTKVSLLTARVRLSNCRRDCAAGRRFKFYKCSQLFIRAHNETAFRPRGVRQQRRSFARESRRLGQSANSEFFGSAISVPHSNRSLEIEPPNQSKNGCF